MATGSGTGTPVSISGDYITQSDVESFFGIDNVAKWSQLDNDTADADTDRIQSGIDWAERKVNARFSGSKYVTPFSTSSVDKQLIRWMATFAGIWIYEGRGQQDDSEEGNKYSKLKQDTENEMSICIASATERLSATVVSTCPTSAQVV